jgi:hypothetical protein
MSARDKLQALLDGKTLVEPIRYSGMQSAEIKLKGDELWTVNCNNPRRHNTPMLANDMGLADIVNWTIKPEVVLINGFEVNKPCTTLEMGEEYYHVDTSECHSSTYYTYRGDTLDNQWLKAGLCHLTKEAADLHLKALLSFTNGDTNDLDFM